MLDTHFLTMKSIVIISLFVSVVAVVSHMAFSQEVEIGGSSKFVLLSQSIHTYSHWIPALEIGLKLRERGHRVVVASVDRTEKTVKPYGFEFVNLGASTINESVSGAMHNDKNFRPMDGVRLVAPTMVYPFVPGLRSYLSNLTTLPDVIVCDVFLDCCADLAKEFGVPYMATAGGNGGIALNDPVWVPNTFANRSVSEQGFITRLTDLLKPLRYLKDMITVNSYVTELRANVSLSGGLRELIGGLRDTVHVVANSYMGFEIARPMSPQFHFLGPFFSSFPQPLDDSLSQWLDEAQAHKQAVVLMAFGGHVIPSLEVLQSLLDGTLAALQTLPAGGRMLIATHNKNFQVPAELSHMVRMQGWIPQTACLAHPAVRILISHGGLNSIHESVWNGKPLLLVPMFGDQTLNAFRVQDEGAGLFLDKWFIHAPRVADAVTSLLTNTSFGRNTARLRALARFNQNIEAAADVVELVASGLGDSYRPLSSSLPFLAAGSWDLYAILYAFLFSVLAAILWSVRLLIQYLGRRVCKRIVRKEKQT